MLPALVDVLADLYCQHIRRAHLAVEKLNDCAQLGRDHVRHEDQAHAPGGKAGSDAFPIEVRVDIRSEKCGEGLS